jgi:ribonucleoside-triphosphate reductase
VDLSKLEDRRAPRYRRYAIIAAVAALVVAGVTAVAAPDYRALVGYGLYAVPAHLLISFMPHEPYQLYAAKLYPPPLVASVGVLACLVAITIDYWLIGWVVRHRLVAPKLDSSKAFKTAERFFGRAPFLLIVASAFLPVPFYPAKILAIAADYPISRFMIALVIGRFPRFWLLALGGQKVQAPNRGLFWVAVALAALGAWGIWRRWRAAHRRA